MTQPTALYRHADASGKCLYIGVTGELNARTSAHLKRAGWNRQIATISVTWFDTREDALAAEAAAVRAEQPPFNKQLLTPPAYPRATFTGAVPEADLLAEIEAYCARYGIGVTIFGKAAVNDPNLVPNLRGGRELRAKTRAAIRAALAALPTPTAQEPAA